MGVSVLAGVARGAGEPALGLPHLGPGSGTHLLAPCPHKEKHAGLMRSKLKS